MTHHSPIPPLHKKPQVFSDLIFWMLMLLSFEVLILECSV